MTEINSYPASPATDVALLGDAIDSRFLKEGDIVERGGACITVTGTTRFDDEGFTAITYRNVSGGVQVAKIGHGIMVELYTAV